VLKVVNVSAHYGGIQVLRRVTFHVAKGEIVSLIGANGAGKSTLLKVISGLHRATEGEVVFLGASIQHQAPERIVRLGLIQVPEARQLFPNLTVLENLELGGALHGRKHIRASLANMLHLFPVLGERLPQKAGTLSGGEQQMLSIARAESAKPRFLFV